jgi:hypothetical protein
MRCRAAATVVDGREEVPLDRRGGPKEQVRCVQNVALSVEVQLDSQQPH